MKSYSWREGDTLDAVAARFGLLGDAVRAANAETDFCSLSAGEEIRLPAPAFLCPGMIAHTVTAGESVASVARKHGVSALCVINGNPYIDPMKLCASEVIMIPAREHCRARYGDRLISISERFGVPVWRLAALNPSARFIVPGMRIRLK